MSEDLQLTVKQLIAEHVQHYPCNKCKSKPQNLKSSCVISQNSKPCCKYINWSNLNDHLYDFLYRAESDRSDPGLSDLIAEYKKYV